jgi:hypothetical protein
MTSPVLDRLVAVGLGPVGSPEVPGTGWTHVWADARDERVEALVGVALTTGALALPAGLEAEVIDAWALRMQSCVQLERVALEAAAELDSIGAEFRILKGTAVAHLDYPDPSWRGFGDLDLLVRGEDYDRVVERLCAAGARRRSAEIRPGFDRRYGKGVCLIREDGAQIDVHRTLATGPFGITVAVDDLFAPPQHFRLAGVELPALPRDLRFLHACLHAVLGDSPPRVAALRDVVQIGTHPDLDARTVLRIASSWRVGAVVARAVEEASTRFGVPLADLGAWARGYRPSRFEERALAAYLGPDRSYARQMVAAVGALPGMRAKLEYVRTMARPDPDYLGARDGSYRARARRAFASRPSGGRRR